MKIRLLTIFILIMPFSLVADKSKEVEFWRWFKANEKRIYNFHENQEEILDEVSKNLKEVSENLAFEVSHEKNGKKEFVISADGIRDAFPTVEALKDSEPQLKFWTVTAFRPRMKNYAEFKLEQNGRIFDPKELWTFHRIQDGHFDLIIYHPNFNEEERAPYINGAYILLDMALGEYDVATEIRYIDNQKLPENPKELGLNPFTELRTIFDRYKANKSVEQTSEAPPHP